MCIFEEEFFIRTFYIFVLRYSIFCKLISIMIFGLAIFFDFRKGNFFFVRINGDVFESILGIKSMI